MKDIISTIG